MLFLNSCSFSPGFKLKDFLHDNETLSEFLEKNATLPKHAVRQIVEANVNLEKVNELHNTSCLKTRPNHRIIRRQELFSQMYVVCSPGAVFNYIHTCIYSA